jgi:hypothetical protein
MSGVAYVPVFLVFAYIYSSPAFILPLVFGIAILKIKGRDSFSKAVGLFTLKPIFAVGLWVLWLFAITEPYYLLFLPGLILTLLLLWIFRSTVWANRRIFAWLLGFDALRWLYTYILFLPELDIAPPVNPFSDPYFLVALILPNLYAIYAWYTVKKYAKSKEEQSLSPITS